MDVVTLGMAKANARKIASSVRAAGSRVVAIGDSITFNFNGGPLKQACQRTGQRALFSGWYATQGYTVAQIKTTHLPTVLALAGNQKPAACAILAGTNNCGADSGTGIGSGFSFATAKADYLAITTALVSAGIQPIVCTVPPRTDTTLANANVRQWNVWLTQTAARNGWPVLDYHSAIVTAGGGWPSLASADGIHPQSLGLRLMSTGVTSALSSLFPPGGPYLSRSVEDPQNFLTSASRLFLSTATNGVAGGWVNYSGGTGQVFTITSDASIAGNWQTLTKPQAATANAYLQTSGANVTTGFAVGDRIAFAAVFQALNFEAQNGQQSANITVDFRNASNVVISSLQPLYASPSDFTANSVAYDEGLVPAGTTAISIGLSVNGTPVTSGGATLQVAQPTMVNLTALGLA